MLKDDVLKSMESIYKDSDGVLLTYQVNSNDHYNATIASEGKLQRIQQNSEIERDTLIDTYTGISLINLSRLKRSDGKSSFFETVANFKKMNIQTINISNSVYWDFGTLDRYYKSMFQIINLIESSDAFVQFLIKNAGIDLDKVSSTSYNTKVDNSINLVKDSYAGPPNKIIIENVGQLNLSDQACIVLGNARKLCRG